MSKKGRRINTYFRQTPRSFRASKYASVFYHIRTNIPQTLNKVSKKAFKDSTYKLNRIKTSISFKNKDIKK